MRQTNNQSYYDISITAGGAGGEGGEGGGGGEQDDGDQDDACVKGGYWPGSGCQEMLKWFMDEAYGGEWCSTKVDQVKSFTTQVNMMILS